MKWLLVFWSLLAASAPNTASLPELLAQDFGSGSPQVVVQPAAGGAATFDIKGAEYSEEAANTVNHTISISSLTSSQAEDDLLILWQYNDGGDDVSNDPADNNGFTELPGSGDHSGGTLHRTLWYKVLVPGDLATTSYTYDTAGTETSCAGAVLIGGAATDAGLLDEYEVDDDPDDDPPVSPALTLNIADGSLGPPAASSMVLWIWGTDGGNVATEDSGYPSGTHTNYWIRETAEGANDVSCGFARASDGSTASGTWTGATDTADEITYFSLAITDGVIAEPTPVFSADFNSTETDCTDEGATAVISGTDCNYATAPAPLEGAESLQMNATDDLDFISVFSSAMADGGDLWCNASYLHDSGTGTEGGMLQFLDASASEGPNWNNEGTPDPAIDANANSGTDGSTLTLILDTEYCVQIHYSDPGDDVRLTVDTPAGAECTDGDFGKGLNPDGSWTTDGSTSTNGGIDGFSITLGSSKNVIFDTICCWVDENPGTRHCL